VPDPPSVDFSRNALRRFKNYNPDGSPPAVDDATLRRWSRQREAEARNMASQLSSSQAAPEAASAGGQDTQQAEAKAAGQEGGGEAAVGAAINGKASEDAAGQAAQTGEKAEEEAARRAAEQKRTEEEQEAARKAAEEKKRAEEQAAKNVAEEKKGAGGEAPTKAVDAASAPTSAAKPAHSALEAALELAEKMVPVMPDFEATSGRVWIVVGGSEAGGIIVRKGKSVQSAEYNVRLSTGTKVEELELQGKRLHYKRLRGDGPDFGWVSIEGVGGKKLMQALDDE